MAALDCWHEAMQCEPLLIPATAAARAAAFSATGAAHTTYVVLMVPFLSSRGILNARRVCRLWRTEIMVGLQDAGAAQQWPCMPTRLTQLGLVERLFDVGVVDVQVYWMPQEAQLWLYLQGGTQLVLRSCNPFGFAHHIPVFRLQVPWCSHIKHNAWHSPSEMKGPSVCGQNGVRRRLPFFFVGRVHFFGGRKPPVEKKN